MKKLAEKNSIKKILSVINKVLDTHAEVVYNDDETVYVNTFQTSVSWQQLINVTKKGVDIEAVNTDEEAEGFVVLMVDLRSDEDKTIQKDIDEELEKYFSKMFEQ